jgi:hypothetical protein
MFKKMKAVAASATMLPVFVLTSLGAFVGGSATVTACNSAWWQQVKNNPWAAVAQFVQYVQTFLPSVQTVWNAIAPLLGVNSAASAKFNVLFLKTQQSLAALQAADKTAQDLQNPAPDFTVLMTDVQADVTALWQLVLTNQPAADAGAAGMVYGAAASDLQAQADAIARWKL